MISFVVQHSIRYPRDEFIGNYFAVEEEGEIIIQFSEIYKLILITFTTFQIEFKFTNEVIEKLGD